MDEKITFFYRVKEYLKKIESQQAPYYSWHSVLGFFLNFIMLFLIILILLHFIIGFASGSITIHLFYSVIISVIAIIIALLFTLIIYRRILDREESDIDPTEVILFELKDTINL